MMPAEVPDAGLRRYRFEPLSDEHLPAELNDLINEILEDYLGPLGMELFVFDAHPQQTCSNKGLCVAYMIKAGVIATLHPEANISAEFGLDAEEDIKRFATAVEALY